MNKAKSRINHSVPPTSSNTLSSKYFVKKTEESLSDQPLPSKNAKNKLSHFSHPVFKAYLLHLPTFILSLPFWISIWYIFTRVEPSSIESFLLPNTYLPLLLCIFLAVGLTLSYLTLNSKLGFLLSFYLGMFLFFKLQHIEINLSLIGVWTGCVLTVGLLTIIPKILHSNK